MSIVRNTYYSVEVCDGANSNSHNVLAHVSTTLFINNNNRRHTISIITIRWHIRNGFTLLAGGRSNGGINHSERVITQFIPSSSITTTDASTKDSRTNFTQILESTSSSDMYPTSRCIHQWGDLSSDILSSNTFSYQYDDALEYMTTKGNVDCHVLVWLWYGVHHLILHILLNSEKIGESVSHTSIMKCWKLEH